jgi:Domain of unknown function (DUF1942)
VLKITTSAVMAVVAAISAIGIASAPPASGYTNIEKFGEWGWLNDIGVVTGWKIDGLKPSSDPAPPQYPLMGKPWEANATVKADRGTVTPIIPNLNARTENGRNYQALWQAYTSSGISGATLSDGNHSTGKIYFDVTGDSPTTVRYNNGVEDLIVWQK